MWNICNMQSETNQMQTIIRKSVFETNSSSCHSLCIKKGDIGKIVIPEGTLFDKGCVLIIG